MSKKFEVVTVFWSATKSSEGVLSLQNVNRLETLLNDGFRIVRESSMSSLSGVSGVSGVSGTTFVGIPASIIYILEKEDEDTE